MCISVMCVEVGRAAGLIRSSQLFPPSLSSRSLEYCAVRSVRLSHNPFITSIAITETSFLSPSHPKRRPHATILRTLPRVCRIWFLCGPIACGLYSLIKSHKFASTRAVPRSQSAKWLTLLIDGAVCRRFANAAAAAAVMSSISRRDQNLISGSRMETCTFSGRRDDDDVGTDDEDCIRYGNGG